MAAVQGEKLSRDDSTGPKLWVTLARAHAALAGFVERSVSAKGLCLSDFMVLEVLLHKGPLPISEIGAKVLLANASMTAAVDRLEKRQLVHRSSLEGDRRVRVVALTAKGKTLITALYQRHAEEIESLMQVLTRTEREAMRSSLKKLGLAAQTALHPAGDQPAPPRKAAPGRKPQT